MVGGWLGGRMVEHIDGWMDGWTDAVLMCILGPSQQVVIRVCAGTDGRMNGWMDRQKTRTF